MHLIEGWTTVLWRSATSWIAMTLGSIVGIVGTHWAVLLGILPFMPFYIQLPVALIVGALVIWGPTMIGRVTEQPKMKQKIAEKSNVAS